MTDWTAPRIAHLTRRWRDGATASTIARELMEKFGQLVSRNAVIGKVGRLGLTHRASPIKSRNPAATKAKREASLRVAVAEGRTICGRDGAKALAEARQRTERATAGPAAQIDVKPDDRGDRWSWKPRLGLSRMGDGARHSSRDACAWPIGDPKHSDFKFCSAKPVVPGRPYCLEHCQRAYRSPDEPANNAPEQDAA